MKIKRLAGLVLAGVLAASVLAGCGGSGSSSGKTDNSGSGNAAAPETNVEAAAIDMNEEPYTVGIQINILPGVTIENEADIEAAVNAITLPAINCNVDLQYVWISEIANTTSLGIAGGEKFDILHVGTVTPLSSMVGSDMLYDMYQDNLITARN